MEEYFKNWLTLIDKTELQIFMNYLDTIYATKNITPIKENVFKAFNLCPLEDTKIVFLGQDPYPQKNVATGLVFGNNSSDMISPSLAVIKEACINYELMHPPIKFDSTLESWAKQGILLLNSALTTEVNHIGSHIAMWKSFMEMLLTALSEYNPGLIYVLFGTQAQSYASCIKSAYSIYKINHPAFYARTNTKMSSKLFNSINQDLKHLNNFKIQWYETY